MSTERKPYYILLTRGLFTIVSRKDYAPFSKLNWYALNNGCGKFYAARDKKIDGKKKTILMHREILGLSGILDGEHKSGNSLDNRRCNLRPASRSQNHANRKRLPAFKSSPFRGVSAHKNGWTAQISLNNRKKHLGYFSDPTQAAKAYDVAARRQFGKFANLNFP